jgi:hypothetical protein
MRRFWGFCAAAVLLLASAGIAHSQATLTINLNAPDGYIIDGLRVFDSNTKNPSSSNTYKIGIGRSVTVEMGAPKDTGYHLSVLQTHVAVLTACVNMETAALACIRGGGAPCGTLTSACIASLIKLDRYPQECSAAKGSSYHGCVNNHDPAACAALPRGCLVGLVRVPARIPATNQGACNKNIAPVDGKIVLALHCAKGQRQCACNVTQGRKIPSQADLACPLSCQTHNPASGNCIGPARDDCKK